MEISHFVALHLAANYSTPIYTRPFWVVASRQKRQRRDPLIILQLKNIFLSMGSIADCVIDSMMDICDTCDFLAISKIQVRTQSQIL